MGFWDKAGKVLGDIAKDAIKETQRKMDKIERYEQIFEGMTDEKLKQKLKTCNDIEQKRAIINILKQRGY